MTGVQAITGGGSKTVPAAGDGDARASEVARDNEVHYVAGEHKFQVTIDGIPTDISPLEAVCLVLQQRYITMSDRTAQQTREMQEQVNEINDANAWLRAVTSAGGDGGSFSPPAGASDGLKEWMDEHGIDTEGVDDSPDADGLENAEARINNYIDQRTSTNDLKMLELKTTVNKTQEALTAADGVLQDLKQLMQTITGNMAR